MKAGRKPTHEREKLMTAALTVAARYGYQSMRREDIATEANCSAALISKYFGTMPSLRRSVMRAAVARGDLKVIAQGLAAGDSNAQAAENSVQIAALSGLMT